MRRALLILFVIIAAPVLLWCGLSRWKQHNEDRITITWTPATSTFDWYAASVVLPAGFTHRRLVRDSPAGREAIRQIGATFQPRTRIPNWLARLVPEFVRVHCRYRFPFL